VQLSACSTAGQALTESSVTVGNCFAALNATAQVSCPTLFACIQFKIDCEANSFMLFSALIMRMKYTIVSLDAVVMSVLRICMLQDGRYR